MTTIEFNEQYKCMDFKDIYKGKCKHTRRWGNLVECKKFEPLLCPYAYYIKEDKDERNK